MASRDRAITDSAVQWPLLRAALAILRSRLGMPRTLAVLATVAVGRLSGAPWKGMPPPTDHKERLSRAEIRDAVLLYRALRRRLDGDSAQALLGEIVIAGALISFDYLLDPLSTDALRWISSS